MSKKLQKGSIEISTESVASLEIKKLLEETVYGKKGKLQYRHKNSSERIASITNPLFVTLKKRDKLLATAGFLHRNFSFGDKKINSWYIRFLSINTSGFLKERGRKSINKSKQKYKSGKGIIKSAIAEIINTVSSSDSGPSLLYAVVEKDNEYSQSLCSSFDFEQVREIKTYIFSRISPKKKAAIRRCQEEDKTFVLSCLRNTYSSHKFWFEDQLFDNGAYFICEQNKEIVAGIKAMAVEWEIISLPGVSGLIIQKLLPWLPFFSNIINPKKLKFIAFEAPFVKEYNEDLIYDLMESVCSELKAHIGMIWIDGSCTFGKRINKKGNWGFISKIHSPVSTDLLVKFINISDEDKEAYRNSPAYISAFDCV